MFVNSSVHYRYRVNLTRSNTWSAQKIIVGLVNHKKVLQWLPRYIFGFGVGCRTTSGRDTPPSRRASQNFTEFSGAGSSLDLESGKGACRHHTHHTIQSSEQGRWPRQRSGWNLPLCIGKGRGGALTARERMTAGHRGLR